MLLNKSQIEDGFKAQNILTWFKNIPTVWKKQKLQILSMLEDSCF